jgi:hypothetical protein
LDDLTNEGRTTGLHWKLGARSVWIPAGGCQTLEKDAAPSQISAFYGPTPRPNNSSGKAHTKDAKETKVQTPAVRGLLFPTGKELTRGKAFVNYLVS